NLPTDQRGAGFARVSGASADIGAFEVQQAISYNFGGFRPPLYDGANFRTGSTVPIKFQLTDFTGDFITRLSAVQSLQVQVLDALGNPFDLAAPGGSGLHYDPVAHQYVFNWRTSGLAAGHYRILLTLDDGTVHTVDLWLI